MKTIRSAFAGVLIAFALAFLIGCERAPEAPPPPPTKYSITLYGDGEVLRSYVGTRANASEGIGYFYAEGDNQYTQVAGSFVMEPQGSPSLAERAADSKYKLTLYSGSKPVRTWYVPDVNASSGIGYFRVPGTSDYIQVGGTFALEPLK